MGHGKSRKSLDLIDKAHAILEGIQPASVRAVCYQLFNRGVIGGMSKANTNGVSVQLTWARERGIIPWAWVVDETREAERIPSWDNPEEILQDVQAQYRKNAWTLQPLRVEIWSEKGTVRGTLAPVLNAYGVTFRVMHGYASATVVHEVASNDGDGKSLVGLYVGDYDPSGMHMSEVDLPTRLARYRLEGLSGPPRIEVKRLALIEEDIVDPRLPAFDVATKRKDSRWAWYSQRYGEQCWELDALSPVILRERVKTAIQNLIEPEVWERCAVAEAVERESLSMIIGRWNSTKTRQARK